MFVSFISISLCYSNFFTRLNILYGIYRNGRSIHVGVVTTERLCENASKLSLP